MSITNGSAPTVYRTHGVAPPEDYSRYVRRTFGRTMRGYNPAEVDAHLQLVEGWFSLAGFDRLLEDRREELLEAALREAEATVERARRQALATAQEAQRQAEATLERARRESETILAEATRRQEAAAAAERRLGTIKKLASQILDDDGMHAAA